MSKQPEGMMQSKNSVEIVDYGNKPSLQRADEKSYPPFWAYLSACSCILLVIFILVTSATPIGSFIDQLPDLGSIACFLIFPLCALAFGTISLIEFWHRDRQAGMSWSSM